MQQPKTWLHIEAERRGMPCRTLQQVQADLAHAKTLEVGTDAAMARLMLRHGRLSDDARAYIAREYPQ